MDRLPNKEKRSTNPNLGLSLGLIYGTALGVVLSAVTRHPYFLAIFVGAGISLGLAFDRTRQERSQGGAPEAQEPPAEGQGPGSEDRPG
ncbi:MAG: hypothetical protein JXA09_13690 [Anaerolineae bacterium]|nr:hypothetical protein [Anaerolineae bacterium]